jgi:hypothetical protein
MLLAAMALVVPAAPGRASTVVNGGFEQPNFASNSYIIVAAGQTTLTGWTVLGSTGSNVTVAGNSYQEGSLTFNAQGNAGQALDLTGTGNTGPSNAVEQAVATTAGQAYRLSFYVGTAQRDSDPPVYQGAASLDLFVENLLVGNFMNSTFTTNAINWRQFTVDFTANDASTLIRFQNTTPIGTNYAGLDTVTLTVVPEPGTGMLGVMALSLVAGARWTTSRRRSDG